MLRCCAQGKTQGPCTIRQFRDWMRAMRGDPGLAEEYRQFGEVSAWRVRMLRRLLLPDQATAPQQLSCDISDRVGGTTGALDLLGLAAACQHCARLGMPRTEEGCIGEKQAV